MFPRRAWPAAGQAAASTGASPLQPTPREAGAAGLRAGPPPASPWPCIRAATCPWAGQATSASLRFPPPAVPCTRHTDRGSYHLGACGDDTIRNAHSQAPGSAPGPSPHAARTVTDPPVSPGQIPYPRDERRPVPDLDEWARGSKVGPWIWRAIRPGGPLLQAPGHAASLRPFLWPGAEAMTAGLSLCRVSQRLQAWAGAPGQARPALGAEETAWGD